jgi:hypothetical protein
MSAHVDERAFILATITRMGSRVRERLFAVGAAVLALAWFAEQLRLPLDPSDSRLGEAISGS